MKQGFLVTTCAAALISVPALAADYPASQAPLVTDGSGYVDVPGALVPIDPQHSYKAIINGEHSARKPNGILPSLGRASMIANALAVAHVSPANMKLVIVFHGPAVDGLLKNEGYKAKFGVDNPNLKVIRELDAAGVSLYVCAQYMAAKKLPMHALTPEIKLATAASLVLITYENEGYASLSDD